jgi:hypothetical protein
VSSIRREGGKKGKRCGILVWVLLLKRMWFERVEGRE